MSKKWQSLFLLTSETIQNGNLAPKKYWLPCCRIIEMHYFRIRVPLYISMAALQKNDGSLDLTFSLHSIIWALCCSLYEVSLKSSSKHRFFSLAQCSLMGPERRKITLPGNLITRKMLNDNSNVVDCQHAYCVDSRQSNLYQFYACRLDK